MMGGQMGPYGAMQTGGRARAAYSRAAARARVATCATPAARAARARCSEPCAQKIPPPSGQRQQRQLQAATAPSCRAS